MYESPIELIQKNTEMQFENGIYKAVTKVGINVDKEELIKALNYDRRQYLKGYTDGFRDSHSKPVIRCKDCRYRYMDGDNGHNRCLLKHNMGQEGEWFCADGEKFGEVNDEDN